MDANKGKPWLASEIVDVFNARSRAGLVAKMDALIIAERIRQDYEFLLSAERAARVQAEQRAASRRGLTLFDRLRSSIRRG